MNPGFRLLASVQREVVGCDACSRLRKYCAKIAEEKRRAYREWTYWGKPVPSFGDPSAGLLIIGLAPGAHGANRTGRMFTGDPSGDFLFRALHRTGFASQPTSRSRDDGLTLHGAYVTAAVRCAPPDNKPLPGEIRNCRRYLERELELLHGAKVIVALGRIAFDVYLSVFRDRGLIRSRAAYPFAHGREHRIDPSLPVLISSYHPSQQNTSTGRLTEEMLYSVFARAKELLCGISADIQPSKLK
ncbi:MAG: uracil-DNA glycosylase [Bryobacteraceae bacterium]